MTEPEKTYNVEFTDTFGGQANYCWAQRFSVKARNMQLAIRKAKQHRYHNPVPRHRKTEIEGNWYIRIDIVGSCVCAFINQIDPDGSDGEVYDAAA